MRKILKTIIFIGIIINFTSCGENINTEISASGSIDLTPGVETQILSGDKIKPADADTVIKVRHNVEDSTKYVSVLKGSITLVRGDYTVGE